MRRLRALQNRNIRIIQRELNQHIWIQISCDSKNRLAGSFISRNITDEDIPSICKRIQPSRRASRRHIFCCIKHRDICLYNFIAVCITSDHLTLNKTHISLVNRIPCYTGNPLILTDCQDFRTKRSALYIILSNAGKRVVRLNEQRSFCSRHDGIYALNIHEFHFACVQIKSIEFRFVIFFVGICSKQQVQFLIRIDRLTDLAIGFHIFGIEVFLLNFRHIRLYISFDLLNHAAVRMESIECFTICKNQLQHLIPYGCFTLILRAVLNIVIIGSNSQVNDRIHFLASVFPRINTFMPQHI